jgi:hypothetical protein
VPTVPEKQIDKVTPQQSIDSKSMCSGEITKSYTFNRWAAYREVKSPPCLGGVKEIEVANRITSCIWDSL